jgi:ubiquinone/menaquinone biosynthesis C-methylase UbiE
MSLLQKLMSLDGFDQPQGSYSETEWVALVRQIADLATVQEATRVLEVGCGAGALLFPLRSMTGCDVYGVDYSANLVETARTVLGPCVSEAEAVALPFKNSEMDVVLSHSVFQYFPDQEYAEATLDEMARVLTDDGSLLLLDLNDQRSEGAYHEDRARTWGSVEEYEAHYSGLSHLFFDPEKMLQSLQRRGFAVTEIFPHVSPNYYNARFRFNVLARRW